MHPMKKSTEEKINQIISKADPSNIGKLISDHRQFNPDWLSEEQRIGYDATLSRASLVSFPRLKDTEISKATGLSQQTIRNAIVGDASLYTTLVINGFIALFRVMGLRQTMYFIDKQQRSVSDNTLCSEVIIPKLSKPGAAFRPEGLLCGFWQVLVPEDELPEALKLHNSNP